MLESNHEPAMLQASARPIQLKRRILGRHGHLSNEDAASAISELLAAESRSLVLAHLSSECNNRELVADIFRKTLANLGRTDILFRIAEQDRPLETFWLAD